MAGGRVAGGHQIRRQVEGWVGDPAGGHAAGDYGLVALAAALAPLGGGSITEEQKGGGGSRCRGGNAQGLSKEAASW